MSEQSTTKSSGITLGRLPLETMILITLGVGFVHHIDHILRSDHSGWPFKPNVTGFTYSLVVYPLLLAAYFSRSRRWLRVLLITPVFALLAFDHILLETPIAQYSTWANGVSNLPGTIGEPNLLHLASPLVGLIAAGWSLLLGVVLASTLATAIREALSLQRNS